MNHLNCSECGEKAIAKYGIMQTLMGYPPFTDDSGNVHIHDDNCMKQNYACLNDHVWKVSERRKCSVEGCGWLGSEHCFCHMGKKVDSFDDDDVPLVKDLNRLA